MTSFLDTNVILRHLLQDNPELSPKATAILRQIALGHLAAHTSLIVIFEVVFTLQRQNRVSRPEIVAGLAPIVGLPGLLLPEKEQIEATFRLYLDTPLGFADCYHIVLMRQFGLEEIFSFDKHFDRIEGVTRREE